MNLAAPLGFLGLIGLAILLLIYLLKPNYQQKLVSSTFVWKLSLKYKKKKVPISKLRNLLILLCQIFTIIGCSFIMAGPFIAAEIDTTVERVAIIDASAGMLASNKDDVTRFERAVEKVKQQAKEVLIDEGGIFSVVLAGEQPTNILQRINAENYDDAIASLDELLERDKDGFLKNCTFGKSDISAAVDAAETLVFSNPSAEIVLYSGTTFVEKGGITMVNVSEEGEWNAAILSCTATLEDGYYVFDLEIACYGANKAINVFGEVREVNIIDGIDDGTALPAVVLTPRTVYTNDDEVSKVTFKTMDEGDKIFRFETAYFYIAEAGSVKAADSFGYDNYYYLHNGSVESRRIRVQYCSNAPNSFVSASLRALRETWAARRDIEIKEIRDGEAIGKGFDFYIFEHKMPNALPDDGVVLLINPNSVPRGITMRLGEVIDGENFGVSPSGNHPITRFLNLSEISVSKYTRIVSYEEDFVPVLYAGGDPMLLVKNTNESKVLVMPFSLNYSDLPGLVHLPILFRNIFEYYMPTTLGANSFVVNETIELRGRGAEFVLSGEGISKTFVTRPGECETVKFDRSGQYAVSQTIISGALIIDEFFVRIPPTESNIFRQDDIKSQRNENKLTDIVADDLVVYFAAVVLFLLAAEWFLHSLELRV